MFALDAYEHDTLAFALNERLDELVAADHVPYLDSRYDPSVSLDEVIAELLGHVPTEAGSDPVVEGWD